VSIKRSWISIVIAVALAVASAACSGSGEDLSGGGGGGQGSSQGQQGGLRRIKAADTAGMPAIFLSYGIQQGYFKAEGLDVDFQTAAGGATVIPALVNGEFDVVGSNVVSVMLAISRGLPIKMIAAGSSTSDDPGQDFSAILVADRSPVRDLADLADKRIAVNTLRNINDVVIKGGMEKDGIDGSHVQFVEMPFPNMLPAIARGQVDAGLLIEPFVTQGMSQGLRDVARPYSNLRPGLQIGTFVMTADKISKDPKLVSAFRAGVQRTADSIAKDPDAFRAALPKIGKFAPELAEKIHINQWKVKTDRASIELIASVMQRIGLMKGDIDFNKAVLS
jgi:NitT/TauT family transport system substrate-binding protein